MDVANALASHSEILLAYLFGSTARGLAGKNSDTDIGILLKDDFKPDRFYETRLAEEIEKKTGMKNIEVTVLNEKKITFLNQVLRYGRVLFSRDEKVRINFETTLTKKYIDLKPYFEEYNRMRRFI